MIQSLKVHLINFSLCYHHTEQLQLQRTTQTTLTTLQLTTLQLTTLQLTTLKYLVDSSGKILQMQILKTDFSLE